MERIFVNSLATAKSFLMYRCKRYFYLGSRATLCCLAVLACMAVIPKRQSASEVSPDDSEHVTPETPRKEVLSGDSAWIVSLHKTADSMEWSDQLVRHEWRLQQRPNSFDCRILDDRDCVVREGTRDICLEAFTALEQAGQMPVVRGPTVIVLHGLGESRRSMRPLVDFLRNHLDATIVSFGYASPKVGITEHANSLAGVIAGLPEANRISFVGHSLGNIVVRRWMGLAPAHDLARIERMVMLGPPNQGSQLAKMVSKIWVLAALSNGAARDLVLNWNDVARDLAVPDCPIGILAGGKGDDRGFSGLLEGDDDAVVRVAETHLEGADDFLLVPVRHAAMMRNDAVQRATVAFLKTGRFGEPLGPQPAAVQPDQPGVPALNPASPTDRLSP